MYSYRPPHMAEQKQDDRLEHTYSSSVRIRDAAQKTSQRRWTIGRSGEEVVRDIHAGGTTWWWWILTGVFSVKSKWLRVSSSLQHLSKYTSLFQQCWGLDGLDFSTDLQFLPFLFHVSSGPVGWGCRMHRFHLCRRVRLLNNRMAGLQ